MTEKETYYFRRLDNGEIVALEMTFLELHERMDVLRRITLDDGTEAERDFGQADVGRAERLQKRAWANGLVSDSLRVHPSQINEFREAAKRDGISIDFTPRGQPIFTSGRQQANYAAHRGCVNHDGIFSGRQRNVR